MPTSLPIGTHTLAASLSRLGDLQDSVSSRVSSGRRLDRPAVDPAGLGQASEIDGEQSRLRAVENNLQNGVSRLQSTSGQLSVLGRVTTRLSELAALASDAASGRDAAASYSEEFTQLQTQLRQIIGGSDAEIGGTGVDAPQGEFNGQPLFGPGPHPSIVISESPTSRYSPPVINLRDGALGDLIRQDAAGAFTLDLANTSASDVIKTLNAATAQIADSQALVGAGQSRLDFASGVAATSVANQEAALSSIRDTDLAKEVTALTRLKMLTESHTAMLTQARDASAKLLPLLSRN